MGEDDGGGYADIEALGCLCALGVRWYPYGVGHYLANGGRQSFAFVAHDDDSLSHLSGFVHVCAFEQGAIDGQGGVLLADSGEPLW